MFRVPGLGLGYREGFRVKDVGFRALSVWVRAHNS